MNGNFVGRGGWWVVAQSLLMAGVIGAGVAGRTPHFHPAVRAAGGLVFALGAACGIAGAAALGRSRTAFPKPRGDGTLVRHGIYAWVRHPLYASVILLSFGWALLWGSPPALALAVVEALFLDAKARREERWLLEKYPDYADYRHRVRRLVPWLY